MDKTINVISRKDLSARLAEKHNLGIGVTDELIKDLFDEIANEVANKNEVSIHGFGKFDARFRAARDGVNPATKEKIRIAESYSPGFKSSAGFKTLVKSK